MKIAGIFILFELSAIVVNAFWAAAARGIYQPIILSVGTIFAAIGLDKQPFQDILPNDYHRSHSKTLEEDKDAKKFNEEVQELVRID